MPLFQNLISSGFSAVKSFPDTKPASICFPQPEKSCPDRTRFGEVFPTAIKLLRFKNAFMQRVPDSNPSTEPLFQSA